MPPDAEALTMTDTLQVAGPELSATSDAPRFKGVEEKIPVDLPEEAGKGENTEGQKPSGEDGEKPSKADATPPAIKREITIERNRRRAAEERATQLEANLTAALAAVEKITGKTADAKDDPRPTRDTFSDPDAYDAALEDWSGRRAATAALADADKKRVQGEQESRAKALQTNWAERKATFEADHPDYADVAEANDLQISMSMAHAILNAEDGPALAYHLGQNPELAERIAKLDPIQAVTELGRISARLVAKPLTPKPNPIRPLGARANAGPKSPDDETMDEYGTRRTAELRERTH